MKCYKNVATEKCRYCHDETIKFGKFNGAQRYLLNLPLAVTIPTGTATYTYDASGNKLRKVSVKSGVTTTTDYIGGIEYDNSSTAIGFIQTEEGKAVPNGTTNYDYYYYLGDNLGNTRVTFHTDSGAASPTQKDDYYPFGLEISRGTVPNPKNEYLYNKKELQEEFAEYDYGARFYDPVIGRWNTIDLLAEVSRRWGTYNYVEDDPIRLTDPDGMETAEEKAQREALEWGRQKSAEAAGQASGGKGGGPGNPFVQQLMNEPLVFSTSSAGSKPKPNGKKASKPSGNGAKHLPPLIGVTNAGLLSVSLPKNIFNSPLLKVDYNKYSEGVRGQKGILGTFNNVYDKTLGSRNAKIGMEWSNGLTGVSVEKDAVTFNLTLGENTYSLGAGEAGILYGTSTEKDDTVNGMMSATKVRPLTAAVALVGPLVNTLAKNFEYFFTE